MAVLNQLRMPTVVSQTDPGTIWNSSSWVNINNVKAVDGAYSYASIIDTIAGNENIRDTYYMYTKTYTFSVPAGSTIKGIRVGMNLSNSTNQTQALQTSLMKNGTTPVGTAKSAFIATGGGIAGYILGTTTDLWGTSWTLSEINAANFGVRLYLEASGSNLSGVIRVEVVQIEVWYESPIQTSDTRDVRIYGYRTSASRGDNLRISGVNPFLERGFFIRGKATSSTSAELRVQCTVNASSTTGNLRISGKATEERWQHLRITGKLTSNTTRDFRLAGILGLSQDWGIRLTGKSTSLNTRDLRIRGSIPSSVDCVIKFDTRGELSNMTADVILWGSIRSQYDAKLAITGSQPTSTSRTLKIVGSNMPYKDWYKSWEHRIGNVIHRTPAEGFRTRGV